MSASVLHILLIEDNPGDVRLLRESLLEAAGFQFQLQHAERLGRGLELLTAGGIDVVLLDLGLPDSAGLDTLSRTLVQAPDIAVIVLTGLDDGTLGFKAIEAGAQDFLVKGTLESRLLVHCIRYAIERARLLSVEQAQHTRTKAAEQRFRDLVEGLDAIVWEANPATWQYSFVSSRAEAVLGFPVSHWLETPGFLLELIHPDDIKQVLASRETLGDGQNHQCEYRVMTADERVVWLRDSMRLVRDSPGTEPALRGLLTDISATKEAEQQLHRVAHFDALTGLPNRRLFHDALRSAIVQADAQGWLVFLLFLDLDNFKDINDSLGHAVGDELLRQVSQRLLDCLHVRDTVGRLGGDEFAVILTTQNDPQIAAKVARRIHNTLAVPFHLEGHPVSASASIGITVYPTDTADIDSLSRYADMAMYEAKHAGRNVHRFYTEAMNLHAREKLELESALRLALPRSEFVLHYQPKICLRTGRWVGMEALLRWDRPGHGLVAPDKFVAALEETGLIESVGAWVIGSACRQLRDWRRAGLVPLPVAVNVSAQQVMPNSMSLLSPEPREGPSASRLTDLWSATSLCVKQYEVPPGALEFELTESTLMSDVEHSIEMLGRLKALGISISIDDFGTGYSSLAYLRRFPIDTVKIDRSFICDLTTDPENSAITVAIITLAHSLRLAVVAEGVETSEQLDFLRAHDCDQAQGFYLARPMPADEIAALFRRHFADAEQLS